MPSACASCGLPILRKDFVVDPYQVYESAVAGADAILLIVAALDDDDLGLLHREAAALDLDVLVEVHDEDELERETARLERQCQRFPGVLRCLFNR